jgi:multiple sugar transport system ATP-binding protein
MGDRIAVMNAGSIVQLGNPLEVYDYPADIFVGGFIGNPPMNFLDARVAPGDGGSVVELSGGSLKLPGADLGELAGRQLTLGIRAEAIGVADAPGEGLIRAELIVLEPLGSHNLLTVRCGEDRLKVSVHPSQFPETGGDVWLRLEPSRIRWMDRESGAAIPLTADVPPPRTPAPLLPS